MKKLFSLLFALLCFHTIHAQEIDCDVTIDMHQLAERYRETINNFEANLEDYINNTRWTNADWENDKIKCTINIVVLSGDDKNRYHAQVFIGSQRPVYKANKNSVMTRIADDKWEFVFARNQRFDHNENRFEELTSFIDFYMHVVLGFDFDSYKKRDGSAHFQKALNIASLSNPSGTNGWDALGVGNYNRVQLVNELLNASYAPLRDASFHYHYNGLDLLAETPEKAKENIIKALEVIAKVRQTLNARSQAIKLFFDTKYLEIAETFLSSNDASVFLRLAKIDPSHQKTYDEYKEKAGK